MVHAVARAPPVRRNIIEGNAGVVSSWALAAGMAPAWADLCFAATCLARTVHNTCHKGLFSRIISVKTFKKAGCCARHCRAARLLFPGKPDVAAATTG